MGDTKCSCGGAFKEILEKYDKDKSNLIKILNDIQEKCGYIPRRSTKRNIRIFADANGRNLWSNNFLFKIHIKSKRKISYSSLFRNSMLCKRFTKNI